MINNIINKPIPIVYDFSIKNNIIEWNDFITWMLESDI